MRGIDELDHYELLEVPRSASSDDIDRAYRLSQQTYSEGSLALYSIFESGDAAQIRERLDEAHRVLSDPEIRAEYDDSRPPEPSPVPSAATSADGYRARVAEESEPELPLVADSVDDAVADYDSFEDEAGGEFDGARLRRARLFRGYELEQITDVTKVTGSHLRNIEDENFSDLPADVYVRGFVTAYAKTIGLDPQVVVPSYMARVQSARSASSRGRFLGRN